MDSRHLQLVKELGKVSDQLVDILDYTIVYPDTMERLDDRYNDIARAIVDLKDLLRHVEDDLWSKHVQSLPT